VIDVDASGEGSCPGELAIFSMRNDSIAYEASDATTQAAKRAPRTPRETPPRGIRSLPAWRPAVAARQGSGPETQYEWVEATEMLTPLDPIPAQYGPETSGR
jgi:hypothetical protein